MAVLLDWNHLPPTLALLRGGVWGFSFGLLIVACWMTFNKRESKAVDSFIDRALRGGRAEERVALELRQLPDFYTVFHDVACPMGNIDHVVVGPTGLFVVETKSHRGTVTVSPDGTLQVNGRDVEKNFIRQVTSQVMWLKDQLKTRLDDDCEVPFVQGCIVFTRGFVKVRGPVRSVAVLPLQWLCGHVQRGKPRLTVETQSRLVETLCGMFGYSYKPDTEDSENVDTAVQPYSKAPASTDSVSSTDVSHTGM